MDKKLAKQIALELNKVQDDNTKLFEVCKKYRENLRVMLDNDSASIDFKIPDDQDSSDYEDIELPYFNGYFGWTDAVIELFNFAGIDAESV